MAVADEAGALLAGARMDGATSVQDHEIAERAATAADGL